MPRAWKRRANSWWWWQQSTVQWFVLVWSDRVWRASHSSCKSSSALLLKMEQHTVLSFVDLSSAFSLTSLSSSPCRSFYCLSVRVLCFGCCFCLCPVCQCALLPEPSVRAGAPRSLTDREPMTAALSQGPVAHSGPDYHTDEVINGLMSFLTHSGPAVGLDQVAPAVCKFSLSLVLNK